MNSEADASNSNLKEQTSEIVAAYLARNSLQHSDLPRLIAKVYSSLNQLGAGAPSGGALMPAVPVRPSVTPDHLICLYDGKKFKSLKRHLRVSHEVTPAQYREKFDLAVDYPMVAPTHSEKRSSLAKSNSLGRKTALSIRRPRKG
jgi:predicted transcriptional regulator